MIHRRGECKIGESQVLFLFLWPINSSRCFFFTVFMAQIDEKDKLKQTNIRYFELLFKDNLEEKRNFKVFRLGAVQRSQSGMSVNRIVLEDRARAKQKKCMDFEVFRKTQSFNE